MVLPQGEGGHQALLLLVVQPHQGAVILLRHASGPEHVVAQLPLGVGHVQNQERHHEKPFIPGLQLGKELFGVRAVGGEVGGQNIHVVAGAHSLFLFLNFHGVQIGDLPLHRLNGLGLVDSLHMEVDDDAAFRVEEVRQYFVGQLRGQDLQETHRPILAAHAEYPAVSEAEGGRGDEILGRQAGGGKPLPVKAEQFAVRVEYTVQHFQPFRPIQNTGGGSHHLEVAQQVGFDAFQPRPRRFQVVRLNSECQILGLDNAVVAPCQLPLQNAGVLGPDVVEVVPLRGDLKAAGVVRRVSPAVDKGKLDVDRGVHIVIEVAEVFKGGCAVVGLGKLVIGVGECNALGKRLSVQPANAVLIHGLIGDALLGGVGLAVALIFADDRLYLPLFGAGQLYRRFAALLSGQSLSPPFPFDAAAPMRRKGCWSDRAGLWAW